METENQTLTTEPTTANISTTSTAETENLLSTKSTRRRKPRKTSESNAKQQKSKNISGNRKNKSTELNISTNESKTMSTRSKDVGNSCTVARKETTRRKKIKLEKEQMEIGNTGLNDLTNSEPKTKTRRTRKKQISVKQEVQTNDDVVINIAQPELPASNNSEDFETKKERNLEMKPSSHQSLKYETRKKRKQPTAPPGEPHVYSPAKRIKSEIKSAQLALRPRRVKPKIMFTGVVDELGEKIVKDLGGHMTDDVQECTHLITDKIRRTVKFLCALVRGAFILNQDWLRESKMQMRFLPEEDYELTDDNNASTNSSISSISSTSNHSLEDQFNFNLHQSLQKSRSQSLPLFHNLRIHATKSVLPPPEQMYSIIGCGGGQVIKKMPRSFDDDVIIVASEADSKICANALKVGAKIVSSEFILTGILRQKLEPDNFRLFQDNSTSSKATSSTTRSARVRKARK
uniref:PAX-interacting protein 1 n=1 Tax=Ciona savignyi TaxID=51511 RepID=H2Z4Z5_CIOSA